MSDMRKAQTTAPSPDHVAPYWTATPSGEDVQIRLWTGYSWIEFGSDQHYRPDDYMPLSPELEAP